MRKILGIAVAAAAILLAGLLLGNLTHINRVEGLNASGAGLELGEWQTAVGIFLTAVVVLGIVAACLLRLRFSSGLLIVSWLTFGLMAAVVWCLHSAKSRIGVINEHGHGLAYDAWQSSVIPWTAALVLVSLCAVSALVHWRLERGGRGKRGAPPDTPLKAD